MEGRGGGAKIKGAKDKEEEEEKDEDEDEEEEEEEDRFQECGDRSSIPKSLLLLLLLLGFQPPPKKKKKKKPGHVFGKKDDSSSRDPCHQFRKIVSRLRRLMPLSPYRLCECVFQHPGSHSHLFLHRPPATIIKNPFSFFPPPGCGKLIVEAAAAAEEEEEERVTKFRLVHLSPPPNCTLGFPTN